MSSKGHLLTSDYTQGLHTSSNRYTLVHYFLLYDLAVVSMGKQHKDFVAGFISTHRVCEDPSFIHLSPGLLIHQY